VNQSSRIRRLSIACSLALAFLLTLLFLPWWATATLWFAVVVLIGTSLFLRRIDEGGD
jgi:4-hydroxybenzoate polyprenyltransferase